MSRLPTQSRFHDGALARKTVREITAHPGLIRDFEGDPPSYLTEEDESGASFWNPRECWSFHTAEWWRNHWQHTGIVDIEHAAAMDDRWDVWLKFDDAAVAAALPVPVLGVAPGAETGDALRADRGSYLGIVEVTARVRG